MKPHVRNYFRAFGYDESSIIMCEMDGCLSEAVDLHHVEPRSSFGSKRKAEQDAPTNIIALCRLHHDRAHGIASKWYKEKFKEIISRR